MHRVAVLTALLCAGAAAPGAWAACITENKMVTCTGRPILPLFLNNFQSRIDGLTVSVSSGTQMNVTPGGHVLRLDGANITLENFGIIDPALLGPVSILSGGALIGAGAAGQVDVTNGITGTMRGTGQLLGDNLSSLDGVALHVNNAAGGTTRIRNDGTITSTKLLGADSISLADTPVVAVQGGARVEMDNNGTITGRVAFESSADGNHFTNSGTITGSVSLGANGSNRFTAVTGSSISAGGGVQVDGALGGMLGVHLSFAPTGKIDGGGVGNNQLFLTNPAGSGISGSGTASSANFVNFNQLTIDGGTWTLEGPLVSGSTTLNGGVARFNDNTAFGAGTLTSNGGTIMAVSAGLTLSNKISLGVGGLTVQGATVVTLNGALSGGGSLTKEGSGLLVLLGANTYSGGTTLHGGTLQVGGDNALGTGDLTIKSTTKLGSSAMMALANNIELYGNLYVGGSNALTLAGVLSGGGGIVKYGRSSLTLSNDYYYYSGSTVLEEGSLIVGSNTALGSGSLNVAGNGTLDASTEVALGNNIVLHGRLTLVGSNAMTLAGVLSGAGGIIKNGTSSLTLSSINFSTGTTSLQAGSLIVGSNHALGSGTLNAARGTTLDANRAVELGNSVNLGGELTLAGSNALTMKGQIKGLGGLIKNGAADLTLNAPNHYLGGTVLNSGTLIVGSDEALGQGSLTVGGASTLASSSALTLRNDMSLNADLRIESPNSLVLGGIVSGSGALIKDGLADLALTGANTFSGTFDILNGSLSTLSKTALGSNAQVKLAVDARLHLGDSASIASLSGNGRVEVGAGHSLGIGANGTDSTFDGILSGVGSLDKRDSGTLTLTGDNTLTGDTKVKAGRLWVDGVLHSAQVRVDSGATLGGSGRLAGAVAVADGGQLALTAGSDLTVKSLQLSSGSGLEVALGAPVVGGGAALLKVDGDLSLNGSLHVSDVGGFGSGLYRLIDYKGRLTDNGLVIGRIPGSVAKGDLQLQWNVGQQLNLLVTAPGVTVQFWDGEQQVADGGVNGGSGTWGGSATNWTDVEGSLNQGWSNSFAVFQGTTATVAVDGAQGITGMQFLTDGYRLVNGTAGSLNLANGERGNASIRVEPGMTATLDVALNGSGTLGKYDGGILVLNAANGYSGGTALNGGTLVLGNAGALGSGSLTTAPGTTLDNNTALSLDNHVTLQGALTIAGANDLTLNGIVGGGGLVKNGAASLTLNGVNTYSAGTTLQAGGLVVGSHSALGSGVLTVAGAATLEANQSVTLANDIVLKAGLTVQGSQALALGGSISGAGGLTKEGTSTLTLNGANRYTGGTHVNSGTLALGAGGSLATSGTVHLASGAIFDLSAGDGRQAIGTLVGVGRLKLGSSGLTLDGVDDSTFGGMISGAGALIKQGAGTVTLTGTNTYGGVTLVAAGTLLAGSATALAQNTAYHVQSGATLDLNSHALQASSLAGGGTVALGSANLTVHAAAGTASSFNGEIEGTGHLIKQGEGTLALNGASRLAGDVLLKQGRINLGHAQGLGTGTLAMDDGTVIGLTTNGMAVANHLHMTGSNDPIIDTGPINATWAGAITGAGLLSKQGSGTLTLSSAGNTYTGATDVAQGTLKAGAAHTFSSSSAYSVASGAVLDLAGYQQTLKSLENSGAVHLGGSTPGAVLKVTGPYVGHNGRLDVSAVLGADGSATGKLLMSGASAVASGSTTLQITHAGGLGAQTTGQGIEVVATENGASLQLGSFTLAGGHVDAGAYEYRLTQTEQGAALHSTDPLLAATPTPGPAYREEAPLLSALPAQLRHADMAMLGDMRKRMGDEGAQAMVSTDQGAGRRVWGRVLRIHPSIAQQGMVSPESSGDMAGFQAGLDLYAEPHFKAGLYVGQLIGNMSVTGFASGVERKGVGFNHLRSRYLGVYGTWQADSGLYADAVLQGADYLSNLHKAGDGTTAATKGSGWLASLEVGKPLVLSSQWQIEPQAQIIYRQLNLKDTALSLATVQHKAEGDWTLRLGARIKGSFATSAGQLQPYGRINVYTASGTSDVARFIAPAATTDIRTQGGNTSTELAAGATLFRSQHASIYGELGKLWAQAGGSRVKSAVQASVGLKVVW